MKYVCNFTHLTPWAGGRSKNLGGLAQHTFEMSPKRVGRSFVFPKYWVGKNLPTLPTYFHRPCWDYYTDDQGAQTTNRNGLQSVWSLSKVETRKDNCHAIAIAAPPCMYLVMWLTGWLLGLFFLRLVTAAWAHNIGLISTKVSEWQKVIHFSRLFS